MVNRMALILDLDKNAKLISNLYLVKYLIYIKQKYLYQFQIVLTNADMQ